MAHATTCVSTPQTKKHMADFFTLTVAALVAGAVLASEAFAINKSVKGDEIAAFTGLVWGALTGFKLVDTAEEFILTGAEGRRCTKNTALEIVNVLLNICIKTPTVFLGAEAGMHLFSWSPMELGPTEKMLPSLGATILAAVAVKETVLKLTSENRRLIAAALAEAATVIIAGHFLIGKDVETIAFATALIASALQKLNLFGSLYIAAPIAQGEATAPLLTEPHDEVVTTARSSWNPLTWLCPRRAPAQPGPGAAAATGI